MEFALEGILQTVGLGGLLVLLIALGWLRTNREVKEKEDTYKSQLKELRIDRDYWRDTSIRLLEVGERMANEQE